MRPPLNAGENSSGMSMAWTVMGRFNEAPAERGGEPGQAGDARLQHVASMRPPLNAGENVHRPQVGALDRIASMRPPLNAGENGAVGAAFVTMLRLQ